MYYITTANFKDRIEDLGATVHTHPDLLKEISIDAENPDEVSASIEISFNRSG
jgi:hypothetical protein